MKSTIESLWLQAHSRFAKRARLIWGTVFLLGLTSLFDGLANYDKLAEEYQAAVDLIVAKQRQKQFRDVVRSIFLEREPNIATNWEERPGSILVDLQTIRPLYREYARAQAAKREEETLKIGNQSLGVTAYSMA